MAENQDKTPEKIRIKDSYRERIFAESQYLDKSYLETLYFIIDCYFAFKKGAFPMQQAVPHSTVFTPVTTNQNQPQHPSLTAPTLEITEDSDSDTFTLDFDL
ncbi:hypothetical protein [Anabaena sp. UHCC 0399]|uniref:hypothetical protein n=1 Tax=Anabaena sp. UHCC 0399 TaxID=3110238 RepID=UPI002B1F665F|nr:hypothetical protein [Anabaena sp. UHCC 0399]MEA5569332.1 hypothetical protein [Anabaena sp. UHCC 0399]